MKKKLCIIVFALACFITILMAAVEIAVYDKTFFMNEAAQNDVSANTGLTTEEISQVTDEIFNYLKGSRDDFDITIKRGIGVIHLFNQDECDHMVDVANLMVLQRILLVVGLITSLILGGCLYRKDSKAFFTGLMASGIGGIIALILATIIASNGFTAVFVALHRLIFTNELWIMDPATEVLINIVPEPYFIHLALYAGILTAMGCVILVLTGFIFRKKTVK